MQTFRRKVSIKGVVIGSITDIVGSNIWGVFLSIYILFAYNLLQYPPSELTNRMLTIIRTDSLVFLANFLVGSAFSILGGYISAFIAKREELLNGALASFLCVASGLCSLATGTIESILLILLGFILSPLLSMFGGFLRLKQRSRNQPLTSTS